MGDNVCNPIMTTGFVVAFVETHVLAPNVLYIYKKVDRNK